MTRDDIIRMARASGLYSMKAGGDFACFEQFARLIAEDCAKRCGALAEAFDESLDPGHACGAGACAVEIREAYKP